MKTRIVVGIAAALGLAGLTGYLLSERPGPMVYESQAIERDSSETLRVTLRMGVGTMKVSGGSPGWMQGDFGYNVPSWKPSIQYSTSGNQGDSRIEQKRSGLVTLRNARSEWDLQLEDKVPTSLTVSLGAGEARLDLGTLSLHHLDIEVGTGELLLDLRGKPSHSYDVRIRGGVGASTVKLPQGVGVRAKAVEGLGKINVQGLRSEGDHWVNDAYVKSEVQVRLDLQGGIGAISLIAE